MFMRYYQMDHRDGSVTCYENDKCVCEFEAHAMIMSETLSCGKWSIKKLSGGDRYAIEMTETGIFGTTRYFKTHLDTLKTIRFTTHGPVLKLLEIFGMTGVFLLVYKIFYFIFCC